MFQVCLPSHSCNYRQWKPAMPKKIFAVFTNMKTENINTKTLRFVLLTHRPCMWPAFATHLKGSQVRTHAAPDLSEASRKKKLRVARKRGKLLRRWGSVVMGQVTQNVKTDVKIQNVSQHPMLLMSIGAVLVLLVLTHIRARRILNLQLLPQFSWCIPQIAI